MTTVKWEKEVHLNSRKLSLELLQKERKEQEGSGYVSEEDEINFVKKLQLGIGRFRGKLPFKFFACGTFGHYAAKCPHKDSHEKVKELLKE